MGRVAGKRYQTTVFSNYRTQKEVEDYVRLNYRRAWVDVEVRGSDFVFYFEEPDSGSGPAPSALGQQEPIWVEVKKPNLSQSRTD
ncbi:hypothetical protein [Pseudomonas gozinkensis]|uniref:hypothetical protein n=1 Tax=Pseudomonas gozinkensis TaxID=2774461 RepID=UPI0017885E77|nr:hypothetical protein [Pseudomonas gozinkensis]